MVCNDYLYEKQAFLYKTCRILLYKLHKKNQKHRKSAPLLALITSDKVVIIGS
jgi:hypothetical protein